MTKPITKLSNAKIAEFKDGEGLEPLGASYSREAEQRLLWIESEHLKRQRESGVVDVPRNLLDAVFANKQGSAEFDAAFSELKDYVAYRSPQGGHTR